MALYLEVLRRQTTIEMCGFLVFIVLIQLPLTLYGYWMFWMGFGSKITKEYKTRKVGFEIEYRTKKEIFVDTTKKEFKARKKKLRNITKQLWK